MIYLVHIEKERMVKLYRQLEGDEELVGGADPGAGVSYCAGVYISRRHKDIPLVYHARIESPQFGEELVKIGNYVRKKTGNIPLLAVERNIGQATIAKLLDFGYPTEKLYRQKTFDRVQKKVEERIGIMTSSANRRKMLDDLALVIRKKELKVYDEHIIREMLTFVIHERTNEPRPESGTFSDLIMATAFAYQLVKETWGKATWLPNIQKETSSTTLPLKAEGFITESWHEPRDWRGA